MQKDSFSTYNPIITFIFFIGAIAMGMCFMHPVFAGCSVVCSFLYYFSIKGTKAVKLAAALAGVWIFLSVINPFFNPRGSIVLFTYFNRPYTFEALLYGMVLAGVIIAALCWFASYNAVMTAWNNRV